MRRKRFIRPILTLLPVFAAVMCLSVPALAASKTSGGSSGTSSASNTVTQTYDAGPSVLSGMIVELKSKDQTTVIPAGSKDIGKMLGVVVPSGDANIVLSSPSAKTQQVLVAATGRYDVLVSDQNGAVKPGDYLTISALDGVSMKAGSDQKEVIGRAAGNFDANSNVIDTVKLKSQLGHTRTVSIGEVQADVRLAPNPLFKNSTNLPGFLASAASSVANKKVSPVRIYLSVTVLAATLFITGVMLYGGIRGGITAIGRNPLAKKAVSQGLAQAVVFGLIIFVLGMLGAYAILI